MYSFPRVCPTDETRPSTTVDGDLNTAG